MITKRDQDRFDDNCDHLLVVDEEYSSSAKPHVIGTQRFLVRSSQNEEQAFYSQSEFDLESLYRKHTDKTFMELGRSCILPDYRNRRTMELMWQGTWAYALENDVDVMVGCASFPGYSSCTDNQSLAPALGLLS